MTKTQFSSNTIATPGTIYRDLSDDHIRGRLYQVLLDAPGTSADITAVRTNRDGSTSTITLFMTDGDIHE